MTKAFRIAFGAVAMALLIAAGLLAQSFTGGVRGTVTDQSEAAIAAARVVVTDAERGTTFNTVSDEAGRFAVTALPPGSYILTAEAPGFKRFSSGRFTIAVQQQLTVNARMEVGDVATVVEVEGSAALVNTTISNLGQVIDNKYILSLPNIARNPMGMTYLTPGVVGSGGRRGDSNTNFVANGSRNSTSDVLLDGVSVATVEQNSGVTDLKFAPSVDVVQEFKMQTNFFSAEYGQTGGAVVNMVTKSGTNEIHGTAYGFFRHSDLNANSWFANRAGNPRPDFRRDQFGGVIGGPVIKNKTFFFGGYEYTRQTSPVSNQTTVPTLLQREGNFSQTFLPNGQLMQLFNPFDTFVNAGGNIERRPFAGNIVPKSMMDPISLAALAFVPAPNQPGHPVAQTNNWFAQGINASNNHQLNSKIDHNFNENNRLSGRYSLTRTLGNPPNLWGDGNPAVPWRGDSRTLTQAAVVDYTRVTSATTLFTFRWGITHSDFWRLPMTQFDLTSLGLPSYMKDAATHSVFPRFSPADFQAIGTEGWLIMDRQESVNHFSGSMTKILGGHNIKTGGEFRFYHLDYNQPGFPSGNFNFARQATCATLFTCPANQGSGMATMLLGWVTGSDFHIEPKAFSRSAYLGFYVQDDWKVTNKLTINLGLRYDFDKPRWEKFDRYSYWDLDAQSSVQVPGFDTRGVMRFVGPDRRSPFDSDLNNFGPRVGFAYAVNSKTAVRGGYGLFYTISRATVFGRPGAGFTINSPAIWSLDANATRFTTMANPFPNGVMQPPGNSQGPDTLIGFGTGPILPSNNRNPEYHSWNLSIQRELPMSSVLELNYTGSRGTHLFMPITTLQPLHPNYWGMGRGALNGQVNNPFFGHITDNRSVLAQPRIVQHRLLRPMPHFNGASVGTSEPPIGDSVYHALQLKWEKRFSRGLTMLTHYTWSKMIDNISHTSGNVNWLGGGTAIQNIWDLRSERALSAHDIAHRVVLTGAWQMPFGRGKRFGSSWNRILDSIAGGWELSGMATLQSGMPLHVTQQGGAIWDGTQRPNLIGDPSRDGSVVDRLTGYFNNAAFSQPAADVPGTAPRTLGYRGPGIRTMDAALLKSFATKEGQRFEFRLEAQNATNTPMFGDPNTAFGSAQFGQINGLRDGVTPRNVQLGLKYYF
ncbi:MAG: TonB-dependent receptor domain-containing protein [Bryobacteraceae bacterium]